MSENGNYLLECRGVTKRFGGLVAVNNVDFYIKKGEIFGMIGPNGSGKSTLFNTISRVYSADGGQVFFNREDITHVPPYAITVKGLGRTYQGSKVFPSLSVLENVIVGRHCRTRSFLQDAIFRTPRLRREEKEGREKALRILELVGLADRKDTRVADLPYGLRSIAGIAIALATEPKLLMTDEPAAGLNPKETLTVMDLLRKMRAEMGITIFLIEHNMRAIMNTAERIMVLNYGSKICEGTPREVSADEQVCTAYLGRGYRIQG
ncbi:MAG: ABC transporter ATP-binding protein [Dehalococcoidales bacterium]|nr:ABC transporter ATP-binding protein [Dehalococcoidales bacterium]